MKRFFASTVPAVALALAFLIGSGVSVPAWAKPAQATAQLALSEIKREEMPVPDGGEPAPERTPAPSDGVPMPDPILRLPLPNAPQVPDTPSASDEPGEIEEDSPTEAGQAPAAAVPEVLYDLEQLPDEVRRMRELLVDAARSGDLERLRPLIGMGDTATQLSFGGAVDDPIAFLRDISGDDDGQEILAILLEVLESGYVHLEPGTTNEIYAWPYFLAVPIEKLTAPQRVELFEIVTAGDYEEMKLYGAYNFYRVGIAPDGRWLFFVAGD